MVSTSDKRKALSAWSLLHGEYSVLCERYPGCACEDAEEIPGTHGPVDDDERIVYVVRSKFDIDLKREKLPIGKRCLVKLFKTGLSHIRLEKVTDEELSDTMQTLYESALNQSDEYGGIVGIVETNASTWRSVLHEERRLCCVYDTPADQNEDLRFGRPAHCDVIFSSADYSEYDAQTKQQIRTVIVAETDFYNRYLDIERFSGGKFAHLQPAKRKQ